MPEGTTIGKLVVKMLFDSTQFDSGITTSQQKLAQVKGSYTSFAQGLNTIVVGAFKAASAAAVGFAGAVAVVGASFEQQMATVAAITGATGEQMAALTDKARELGRSTEFTATQAGQGLEALARAGFSVEDSITASNAALLMAGTLQSDLGESTELLAATVKQFGLDASDAARITDVFSLAARKSLFDFSSLREAMKYAGTAGAAFGMTLEETTASVAAFRNLGLEGSMAGTNFRMALTAAATETDRAAKALDKYGLTFRDINPEVNSFADIIDVVANMSITATDAVEIFGRTGANITQIAANVRAGKEDIRGLTETLQNSAGSAADMYEALGQSVAFNFKLTVSALQDFLIEVFDAVKAPLAALLGDVQGFFNVMSAATAAASEEVGAEFGKAIDDLRAFLTQNAEGIAQTFVDVARGAAQAAQVLVRLLPILDEIATLMASVWVATRVLAFAKAIQTAIATMAALRAAMTATSATAAGLSAAMGAITIAAVALTMALKVYGDKVDELERKALSPPGVEDLEAAKQKVQETELALRKLKETQAIRGSEGAFGVTDADVQKAEFAVTVAKRQVDGIKARLAQQEKAKGAAGEEADAVTSAAEAMQNALAQMQAESAAAAREAAAERLQSEEETDDEIVQARQQMHDRVAAIQMTAAERLAAATMSELELRAARFEEELNLASAAFDELAYLYEDDADMAAAVEGQKQATLRAMRSAFIAEGEREAEEAARRSAEKQAQEAVAARRDAEKVLERVRSAGLTRAEALEQDHARVLANLTQVSAEERAEIERGLARELRDARVEQARESFAEVARVGQRAADAIRSAFNRVSDAVKGIASAALSAFGGLTGFAFDLAGAVEDLTAQQAEAQQGGATFDVESAAASLVDGLVQGALATVQMLVDAAPTLLSELAAGLPVVIQALGAALPSLFSTIATALPDLVGQIVEVLPDVIDGLVAALPDLVDGIIAVLPDIVDFIVAVLPDLIQVLADNIPKIIDVVMTELPRLVTGILAQVPSAVEVVAQAVVGILSGIPDLIQAILAAIPDIILSLVAGIDDILVAVLDLIPVLIETIIAALPDIILTLIQGVLGLVVRIAEEVPVLIARLVELVPVLIEAVLMMLPVLITAILDAVPAIILGVVRALPLIITALVTLIPEVISALVRAIPLIIVALVEGLVFEIILRLPEIIYALVEGIVMGLWGAVTEIADMFREAIGKAFSFLENLNLPEGSTPVLDLVSGFLSGGSAYSGMEYVAATQRVTVHPGEAIVPADGGHRAAVRGAGGGGNPPAAFVPTAPGGGGGGSVSVALVVNDRVLDDVLVSGIDAGHAPKITRKIDSARGTVRGFSPGRFNPWTKS